MDKQNGTVVRHICWVAAAIAVVATLGHLLDIPWLTRWVVGPGMALETSVCIILLSAAMIYHSRDNDP